MITYDSPATAADAVIEFYYVNKAALPEHVTQRLSSRVGTGTSPVDLIVDFSKAAYANKDAFPAEGNAIAAGCAQYCSDKGFHDLGGTKGSKMASVLDGKTVTAKPEPDSSWLPPETDAPATDPAPAA